VGGEGAGPEYYTARKLLAQALGMGSTEIGQIRDYNAKIKAIEVATEKEVGNLVNKLDLAMRPDVPNEAKVDEAWANLDEFYDNNPEAFNGYGTVMQGLETRRKNREEATYSGGYMGSKEFAQRAAEGVPKLTGKPIE
jgi:hypothetical protein